MSDAIDTPLNLSTTRNSEVLISTLQEQKSNNCEASCKQWTSNPTTLERSNIVVPLALRPSVDWPGNTSTSDDSASSSPLTDRKYGQFHLSPVKYRGPKHPVPDEMKDERYFKRRRRNNEAAKRSRLARKERQDAELHRIALIELENAALRTQMLSLRAEYETLAQILVRRQNILDAAIIEQNKYSNFDHDEVN